MHSYCLILKNHAVAWIFEFPLPFKSRYFTSWNGSCTLFIRRKNTIVLRSIAFTFLHVLFIYWGQYSKKKNHLFVGVFSLWIQNVKELKAMITVTPGKILCFTGLDHLVAIVHIFIYRGVRRSFLNISLNCHHPIYPHHERKSSSWNRYYPRQFRSSIFY